MNPTDVYEINLKNYDSGLRDFDAAVCEALAVSQALANRLVPPYLAYSTKIFTSLCSHAVSMIRACPRSRWVTSEFDHWAFSSVAGHSRAIIEGQLLLLYLIETPQNEDEWMAKMDVMHLNDCCRRLKLFNSLKSDNQTLENFKAQAQEIKNRLNSNSYFVSLSKHTKARCLAGDFLMIKSRDEMLVQAGWDINHFNGIFDLLSQHTHILPMGFYRMEANGRGSGLENDVDRSYIYIMLDICTQILKVSTDSLIQVFPDVSAVREGNKSQFSPGPLANRLFHTSMK